MSNEQFRGALLRQLRQIRNSVSTATFQTLVIALVMSSQAHGNVVLIGLPIHLTRRLQSVQNAVARLVCKLRRFHHITDELVSLLWLRIPECIVYKIAVLTFKVLHGTAPEYISWTCRSFSLSA